MSTKDEAQHTPGPWMVAERNTGERSALLVSKDDCMNFGAIAEVYPWNPGGDPQANARLIAAAPDLLAACEAALDRLTDGRRSMSANEMEFIADELRTAIAAARGKS